MKRIHFLRLSMMLGLLWGCEEVIDLELKADPPKLVVNGLIRVDKSQEFVDVEIKVTETSDFFDDNTVTLLDGDATILYGIPLENDPTQFEELFSSSLFELNPGSGIYVPNFTLATDQRIQTANITPETIFILLMTHKERNYAAISPYFSTVPIDNLEEGDGTLFNGDETEIKVTLTDTQNTDDYYVFDFGFDNFLAIADLFFDGQEFEFSYFYDKQFDSGSNLEISILGANLEFFNYMNLLIDQSERDAGAFETPVATVRGNIVDITGLDISDILGITDISEIPELSGGFAFGYFAVSQEFKSTVTIE